MTYSIALSVYNGSKYIIPQLESLFNQSVMAKEVFIIDDSSTDNSVQLIIDFINSRSLTNWKLIRNPENMGWKHNFKYGFDLCTADVIFPCDQDDIWMPDKCKLMVDALSKDSSIELLVSNYNVLIMNPKTNDPYIRIARKMKNDENVIRLPLDAKWAYVSRPGCTYAIKRSFYNDIERFWDENLPHDAILWRYARMRNSLAVINMPLIQFRRHSNNASGVRPSRTDDKIRTFEIYQDFFLSALEGNSDREESKMLSKGVAFYQERISYYQTPNLLTWIKMSLIYHKYYLSWKGIAQDLLMLKRGHQE